MCLRVENATSDREPLLCPVCGNSVDSFRPLSHVWERSFWVSEEGQRLRRLPFITQPNLECPHCCSHERHRLLWLYVTPRIAGWQNLSLLDIGPSTLLRSRLFEKSGMKYFSMDREPSLRPTFLADVCTVDTGRRFDVIVCSHVLEHIDDDRLALQRIGCMMSQDSVLLVQVPIWSEETVEGKTDASNERLYGHPDHRRRYGPDIKHRIREEGFEVDTFRVSDGDTNRFGLDPAEFIYVCRLAGRPVAEMSS